MSNTVNPYFQEEFELAQRKFLRHISMLAGQMDTIPYPRLFVLDFHKNTAMEQEEEEASELGLSITPIPQYISF